jgi:hypothetical protein
MKNFIRAILATPIAALLIVGASMPVDALAAPRPGAYDGQWSVVIQTTRGDCDRALRYSVRIAGGRVVSEDPSYRAYGAVGPNGTISVTVAQGNRSASGYGRLIRDGGRGIWHTSTGQCSGQWTAERHAW